MKNLLKLEEMGQFLLATFLFSRLDYAWWVFPACILLPDFSMIGYLVNSRVGAWLYNFFHHKMLGIAVLILGLYLHNEVFTLTGTILFGHSAMDRMFGYGLKFSDHFNSTHLGRIGKRD